ncbi:hypothetical protein PT277_05165 [Acetobacteraceae bacterium ESL0709]|nr:hypothetical protein [Acetobacteraceae bacterium ESL0697]MDF7678085.1 hypothetical protein [Acetobacteraceae bacterium ESL0709]
MTDDVQDFVTQAELREAIRDVKITDSEHDRRLSRLESQLSRLETQLTQLNTQVAAGFAEINNSIRHLTELKTWATGVGAAIGTAVAYALINLFIHGGHL